MTRVHYDLYLDWPATGVIRAAECVLEEIDGRLRRFGFRHVPEYLAESSAISLDPAQLPKSSAESVLDCDGGLPALLDDYLPDAWGRRVLARLAMVQRRRRFDANSIIEALELIGTSRIGTILIEPRGGTPPEYTPGHPIEDLARAERLAQRLDTDDFEPETADELDLIYLAHSGTGVGGARPKALFYDDEGCYLAKFNRLTGDPFNNARVELACLQMAACAGIEVPTGRVTSGINGREVLLLNRFDVCPDGGRYHLVTVNGLLKEPGTQRDTGSVFRYDDIHELLVQHSCDIHSDLTQLLKRMLFNRSIRNVDDHERNFSLINRGDGYRLSPAYDLVPSLTRGAYHAAGYHLDPNPPTTEEVLGIGRVFGISKNEVRHCAEEVMDAVSRWADIARDVGVDETDLSRIRERLV